MTIPLEDLWYLYKCLICAGLFAGTYYLTLMYVKYCKRHSDQLYGSPTFQRLRINIGFHCMLVFILAYWVNLQRIPRLFLMICSGIPISIGLYSHSIKYLKQLQYMSRVFIVIMAIMLIITKRKQLYEVVVNSVSAAKANIREFQDEKVRAKWIDGVLPNLACMFWCSLFSWLLFKNTHSTESVPWQNLVFLAIFESCSTSISSLAFCFVLSKISMLFLSVCEFLQQGVFGCVDRSGLQSDCFFSGMVLPVLLYFNSANTIKDGCAELEWAYITQIWMILLMLRYMIWFVRKSPIYAYNSQNTWTHRARVIVVCTLLCATSFYLVNCIDTLLYEVPMDLFYKSRIELQYLYRIGDVYVMLGSWVIHGLASAKPEIAHMTKSIRKNIMEIETYAPLIDTVFHGFIAFGEFLTLCSKEELSLTRFCCSMAINYIILSQMRQEYLRVVTVPYLQEAVKKTKHLPNATLHQIKEYQDDCHACFNPLGSSVFITQCQHYFHETCLVLWLVERTKCPKCFSNIDFP